LRSLYEELSDLPDVRRKQGMKHSVVNILTVHVLAELAIMKGCIATAKFASTLTQEQLKAIGAWKNPRTGVYVPVSKSTIHHVLQSINPETIAAIIRRWTQVRLPLAKALATDGKRLRNALHNRDRRYETVTLADHDTRNPFAVLNIRDNKDEIAATQELLQRCDIAGKIITVDALHTTRKTASIILQTADYLFTIKENTPRTFDMFESIDWDTTATTHFMDNDEHLEQRSIAIFTPPVGLINYPGIQQIVRITHYSEPLRIGPDVSPNCPSTRSKITYIITSLDADTTLPEDLLRSNYRNWIIAHRNHRQGMTQQYQDAFQTQGDSDSSHRTYLTHRTLAVVMTTRQQNENSKDMRHCLEN